MALDTYANLQLSIASWLMRDGDTNIAGIAPDLITLFEEEARDRLKTRFNETTATLTATGGVATVALPSDFYEARELTIAVDSGDKVLSLVAPEQLDAAYPSEITDEPIFGTIVGTNLRFKPIPGQNYTLTLTYMQGITGLSATVTTNWLLQHYPSLYLFGALTFAAPFIGEDERVTTWRTFTEAAFQRITETDIKARWSGSALVMRTDTGNP